MNNGKNVCIKFWTTCRNCSKISLPSPLSFSLDNYLNSFQFNEIFRGYLIDE